MNSVRHIKLVISIQFVLIIGLAITVIWLRHDAHRKKMLSNAPIVLGEKNQSAFKRINEMVRRFNEQNGDILTIISPSIDSGPWIHDVYPNGSDIVWIVDNTRDSMSAERIKTEYICQKIEMSEYEEHFVVELSKCMNFQEEEKLPIMLFRKDEL